MEEVSLEDLQQALASAQQQKSAARLSERNVVELVAKLQGLGLLGPDLLHSVNGRDYLTAAQLQREVEQAVDQAGGRLPLVDLPAALGVDLVHCQRAADAAVAASGGRLAAVQGELVAAPYWDALAAEVDDLLAQAGMLTLGDLARRFALGADLLSGVIRQRMGSLSHGSLEGGVLYTPAHIARIKAKVRGALRGAAAPLAVAALLRECGLEGLASAPALLSGVIADLAAAGEVEGALRGGGTTWAPAAYSRAQHAAADAFFRQNGYVEYEMVAKLGIPNARQYLAATFPDGIALETAYVAPALLAQLDGSADEALASGSWCDVHMLLPGGLTPADAAALLAQCPCLARASGGKAAAPGRGNVLAGTCVVSAAFIEQLQQRFIEEAHQAAQEALRQRQVSSARASTSGAPPASQPDAPQQQQAAGKKAAGKAAASGGGSDNDDDWSTGARGKKGKAAKKKPPAKGGKASGSSTPPQGGKGGGAGSEGGAVAVALAPKAMAATLCRWQPDLEDAGEGGGLPRALAALLRPAAVAEYEKTLAAVFVAGAEARRRRREALARGLDEAFGRMQLLAHGAELLTGDEATHSALQRHLVRSLGAEAVDLLLRCLQLDQQDEAAEEAAAAAQAAPGGAPEALSAGERGAILQKLPRDVGPPAAAAVDWLSSSAATAADMITALEEACTAAGVRVRRLDRKGLKSALAAHRLALVAALGAGDQGGAPDPAATLALAVPLLFIQARHALPLSELLLSTLAPPCPCRGCSCCAVLCEPPCKKPSWKPCGTCGTGPSGMCLLGKCRCTAARSAFPAVPSAACWRRWRPACRPTASSC